RRAIKEKETAEDARSETAPRRRQTSSARIKAPSHRVSKVRSQQLAELLHPAVESLRHRLFPGSSGPPFKTRRAAAGWISSQAIAAKPSPSYLERWQRVQDELKDLNKGSSGMFLQLAIEQLELQFWTTRPNKDPKKEKISTVNVGSTGPLYELREFAK